MASNLKEDKNKPTDDKTFSNDELLPSLPLPSLESTLKKYLESIRPFVTHLEYLETEKKVLDFQNGLGKRLQFYLQNKQSKERNWVFKLNIC